MKTSGWMAALAAALVCAGARAQWTTQEVALRAGWNAVSVQVAPAEGTLEALLEAVGTEYLEGIWRWDKTFSTAEYVVDEDSPLAKDPHWKVWYPEEGLEFLSTLGAVGGGRSYLVKLSEDAPGTTVAIKGKARMPRVEWYPNALNLVGFPVGEAGATFEEWFEADGAVDLSKGYGNGAWQIGADGTERTVAKPSLQTLGAGEAVWVRCDGASAYAGPLGVAASGGSGEGLDFGEEASKISLTLENLSATRTRELRLALADSEEAPEGEEQVLGGVPLHLAEGDGWTAFSETTVTLGPGESWTGTFGVDRAAMQAGWTGWSYQSVLRVRDAEGKIAVDVPVRAARGGAATDAGGEGIGAVEASAHPQAGLWIGEAELTAVNCPNYKGEELLAVRHPARLKLVVHVDSAGTARLLKEAWVAAATNGSGMAVYARRGLVPEGAEDVWRASSATLPGMAPLAIGTNGLSGALGGTVELAFDDPVNPFFHRYHPLFDNKNGQFETYGEAVESRSVSREISLEVGEAGAEALANADAAVSGVYAERLSGLRAQEIAVEGTFRLEKALGGAALVDGSGE